jgi:ragB/susD domain protein
MKHYKLMILGMIGLFLTGGCSDFLEEKSQDEVIPTTTADYSGLVIGCTHMGAYDLLHVLDDDLQLNELYGDYENSTAIFNEGCFTWQPDVWERVNTLKDEYRDTYNLIVGLNAVLEGIDDAKGTLEEKELVTAQALGLRSFYYYLLVNLYGEPYNYNKKALGVPLKLTAALTENGIARSTVEEVYDRIVKDLEEASGLFGKYSKQRGNYRINGTTVDILLSRVYLYMEEWDKAIKAADRAIKTAEGLTDYTKFATGTPFRLMTYDHSEIEWLYGTNYVSYIFIVSESLLSSYTAGDRRKEFWYDSRRFVVKKETSNNEPTNAIRVSEAYLNRAEARVLSENINLAGALSDLNELRRHRIMDYRDVSIMDAGVLLEEIRKERRVELCFDWHRWFDLRRYGMPSISHDYKTKGTDPWLTYTLREKDPLYTLPIPKLMMRNNPELEQNSSANEPARMGIPKV